MKTFAILLTVVSLTMNSLFAEDVTIKGTLEFKELNGQTYYVIKVTNPQELKGQELQIAGLGQKSWTSSQKLVGKEVQTRGRLMEANTRYHHTPLLVITHYVRESSPEIKAGVYNGVTENGEVEKSPDGLTLTRNNETKIIGPAPDEGDIVNCSWSPDGKYLVVNFTRDKKENLIVINLEYNALVTPDTEYDFDDYRPQEWAKPGELEISTQKKTPEGVKTDKYTLRIRGNNYTLGAPSSPNNTPAPSLKTTPTPQAPPKRAMEW